MDNEEAVGLVEQELAKFRGEDYADLVRRIRSGSVDYEVSAPSGKTYQVEVQFLWDSQPGGDIRVMGSIDDSGWRAFVPLNRAFIKAPDGSFVGE